MKGLHPPPIPEAGSPDRPAYLWVLLVATIGYLILELGFNARLLDVVGSGADLDQIKAIEVAVRVNQHQKSPKLQATSFKPRMP